MQDTPVIDIHCHGAGIGAGKSGCHVTHRLRHSWKFRYYLKAFGVTIDQLEREGDMLVLQNLSEQLAASHSVHKAVIIALDGVIDSQGRLDKPRTELFIPNTFIEQACRKYPNLLFGASINPWRRDALDCLDKAAASGAVLLKWLPSIKASTCAPQPHSVLSAHGGFEYAATEPYR